MNKSFKHLLTTSSLSVINISIISTALFLAPIVRAEDYDIHYNPSIELSTRNSKKRNVIELDYMQPIWNNEYSLSLIDLKLKIDNDKSKEINLGLALRHNFNDNIIIGFYNYFDHRRTGNNFAVNGLTTGVEALSKYLDARVNFYIPENKKKKVANNNKKTIEIKGTSIYALSGGHKYEYPLKGYDIEVGAPVFGFSDHLNEKFGTKLFVARYDFRNKNTQPITGIRFRLEQQLGTMQLGDGGLHFTLNAETQYDKIRKRQNFVGLGAKYVFGESKKSVRKPSGLRSRMMNTITRDVDIVTTSSNAAPEKRNFIHDGREIKNLYYVGAAGSNYEGNGTKENPYSVEQLDKINITDAIIVITPIDSSKGGEAITATTYKKLQDLPQVINGKEEIKLQSIGNDQVTMTIHVSEKEGILISGGDANTTILLDTKPENTTTNALATAQETGANTIVLLAPVVVAEVKKQIEEAKIEEARIADKPAEKPVAGEVPVGAPAAPVVVAVDPLVPAPRDAPAGVPAAEEVLEGEEEAEAVLEVPAEAVEEEGVGAAFLALFGEVPAAVGPLVAPDAMKKGAPPPYKGPMPVGGVRKVALAVPLVPATADPAPVPADASLGGGAPAVEPKPTKPTMDKKEVEIKKTPAVTDDKKTKAASILKGPKKKEPSASAPVGVDVKEPKVVTESLATEKETKGKGKAKKKGASAEIPGPALGAAEVKEPKKEDVVLETSKVIKAPEALVVAEPADPLAAAAIAAPAIVPAVAAEKAEEEDLGVDFLALFGDAPAAVDPLVLAVPAVPLDPLVIATAEKEAERVRLEEATRIADKATKKAKKATDKEAAEKVRLAEAAEAKRVADEVAKKTAKEAEKKAVEEKVAAKREAAEKAEADRIAAEKKETEEKARLEVKERARLEAEERAAADKAVAEAKRIADEAAEAERQKLAAEAAAVMPYGVVDSGIDRATLTPADQAIYDIILKVLDLKTDDPVNHYVVRAADFAGVKKIIAEKPDAEHILQIEEIINHMGTHDANHPDYLPPDKVASYRAFAEKIHKFENVGKAALNKDENGAIIDDDNGQLGVGVEHNGPRDVSATMSIDRLNKIYGILDGDKALALMFEAAEQAIRSKIPADDLGKYNSIEEAALLAANVVPKDEYRDAVEIFLRLSREEKDETEQEKKSRLKEREDNRKIIENEVNNGFSIVNRHLAAYRALKRIEDDPSGVYTEEILGRYNVREDLAYVTQAILDVGEVKHSLVTVNKELTPQNIFNKQKDNIDTLLTLLSESQRGAALNKAGIDTGIGGAQILPTEIQRPLEDMKVCAHGVCSRIIDAANGNHRSVHIIEDTAPDTFNMIVLNKAQQKVRQLPLGDQKVVITFINQINDLEVTPGGSIKYENNNFKFDVYNLANERQRNLLPIPQVAQSVFSDVLNELNEGYNFLHPDPKFHLIPQKDVFYKAGGVLSNFTMKLD